MHVCSIRLFWWIASAYFICTLYKSVYALFCAVINLHVFVLASSNTVKTNRIEKLWWRHCHDNNLKSAWLEANSNIDIYIFFSVLSRILKYLFQCLSEILIIPSQEDNYLLFAKEIKYLTISFLIHFFLIKCTIQLFVDDYKCRPEKIAAKMFKHNNKNKKTHYTQSRDIIQFAKKKGELCMNKDKLVYALLGSSYFSLFHSLANMSHFDGSLLNVVCKMKIP